MHMASWQSCTHCHWLYPPALHLASGTAIGTCYSQDTLTSALPLPVFHALCQEVGGGMFPGVAICRGEGSGEISEQPARIREGLQEGRRGTFCRGME